MYCGVVAHQRSAAFLTTRIISERSEGTGNELLAVYELFKLGFLSALLFPGLYLDFRHVCKHVVEDAMGS
jgi:hypothetical protein